jgi:hypothetical protein
MDIFATQLRYVLRGVQAPAWLQDFAAMATRGSFDLTHYQYAQSSGIMTVGVSLQAPAPGPGAQLPRPIVVALSFPLVDTMNVIPAQVLAALPKELGAFIASSLELALKQQTQAVQ